MAKFILPTILSALVLNSVLFGAEPREWTRSEDGKTVTAEFVGMKDDDTVTIRMANGRTFDVPLASLSPEDGEYAKAAAAQMSGGSEESSGGSAAIPEGETTLTLSGVHLCCGTCVSAVGDVSVPDGVTLKASRSDGSIVVEAPTGKDAQKALKALYDAGFYGESDHAGVRIAPLKEDDFTTDTMVVRDTHLCCGGCVRSFKKAVESVAGVDSCDAKNGASRVQIKGKDFKPYDVMLALREAGFGGRFQ